MLSSACAPLLILLASAATCSPLGPAYLSLRTRANLHDSLASTRAEKHAWNAPASRGSVMRRVGALRGGGGGGGGGSDAAAFAAMMQKAGATGSVELRVGERGRGVFATEDINFGDELISVPLDKCLVAHRSATSDEVERVLGRSLSDPAQAAALTWDVRLAVALLAATGKVEREGMEKSAFWEEYATLLPERASMTQPLCLHKDYLDRFGHQELADGGSAQQKRLRMLFPELMPKPDAKSSEFPAWIMWAFACVRSRAYTCLPPLAERAAGAGGQMQTAESDEFAFVPLLDFVNHGEPNADFECAKNADPTARRFILRALAPIQKGEEVLINYRVEMSNRICQALYGFVPRGGNHNDVLHIPRTLKGILEAQDRPPEGKLGVESPEEPSDIELHAFLLEQALGMDENNAEQILSNDPRLNAVLQSLPMTVDTPSDGIDPQVEASNAQLLLDFVSTQMREISGTAEEDEQFLLDGAVAGDPREQSAMIYRVERRALFGKAVAILQGYIGVLLAPR